MLRSWIFIPGNQDKHLKKANSLEADAIIFDLEDAVSPSEKAIARLKVAESLQKTKETLNFVRVNALSTVHFLEDVDEVVSDSLAGIVLPKVEKKEDIVIAEYILGQSEEKYNLPPGSISIIPIIETAIGLHHAYEIVSASKRISRLAFGAEDFMLDLNIESRDEQVELLYTRSKLITASRAAGKEAPIDSVYTNFKEEKGLEKSAQIGRNLGFQGKLLIHPKQIEVVNQVFSPTEDEIKEAKRILEIYEESVAKGNGSIEVDGKMVDIPVAERAKKILSYASVKEH